MVSEAFLSEIFATQDNGITKNVALKDYTSFKIGGKADLFIEPKDEAALCAQLALCKEYKVPYFFLGAGSNLLVSDAGVDGVVFHLAKGFDEITVSGTKISAGAAVSLAKLAKEAQRASLSGLEFASGIPGLLGGAVYMNAGAYGGEMKDVITSVTFLNENGEKCVLTREALDFSYRHSVFSDKNCLILSAEMDLTPKNAEEILETMRDLNGRRKEKQPLEKPSAGSTFKRPEGYFAAKLIEDAGLKGVSVGGAAVSEKHAGFVVNNGNATCKDVLDLIAHVQTVVKEKFGVELETEVKFVGR